MTISAEVNGTRNPHHTPPHPQSSLSVVQSSQVCGNNKVIMLQVALCWGRGWRGAVGGGEVYGVYGLFKPALAASSGSGGKNWSREDVSGGKAAATCLTCQRFQAHMFFRSISHCTLISNALSLPVIGRDTESISPVGVCLCVCTHGQV